MATVITEECINCGACEPECPNTAIYAGGVEWELDGVRHPPLSDSIFYIVPEKCTECVGFYDHEACAAVCPVDCCVPDPNRPESEEVLIERARRLHPEREFGVEFPSRFRKAGESAGAVAPAVAEGARGPSVEAPKAEAAPAPARATPAPPSPPAPPPPSAATGRVERPKAPPPPSQPRAPKAFPGELPGDFEEVLAEAVSAPAPALSPAARLAVGLLSPVLGALPHAAKVALERAVGDRRRFSNAAATGLNVVLNVVLYPVLAVLLAWLVLDADVFSQRMNWYIFFGTLVAGLESVWRLRDGVFGAEPVDRMRLGAALYGLPLRALVSPLLSRVGERRDQARAVGFDGFYGGAFDAKIERERRYGDVYRLEDLGGAYLLRLEFPRALPPTGLKGELGLPDTMPDYDYELALRNGSLVVRGRVTDPRVLKLTSVAPAFPPEFTTEIDLHASVRGFKHRYRDKVLEVVLPKRV